MPEDESVLESDGLGVEEAEYLGHDVADIGKEKQHQGDADDGIQHGQGLAHIRLGRGVSIPFNSYILLSIKDLPMVVMTVRE